MSTDTVSPLRQRMIEDMNARKLCAGTQRGHISSCKRFAAFLKRTPDTAKDPASRDIDVHWQTGVAPHYMRLYTKTYSRLGPLAALSFGDVGQIISVREITAILRRACPAWT